MECIGLQHKREGMDQYFDILFGQTSRLERFNLPHWVFKLWSEGDLGDILEISINLVREAGGRLGRGKSCHFDNVLAEFVTELEDDILLFGVNLFKLEILNRHGYEPAWAIHFVRLIAKIVGAASSH